MVTPVRTEPAFVAWSNSSCPARPSLSKESFWAASRHTSRNKAARPFSVTQCSATCRSHVHKASGVGASRASRSASAHIWSTRSSNTASRSARWPRKWRCSVAEPTPARRAISSSDAAAPSRRSNSAAAFKMATRFCRASARRGLPGPLVTSDSRMVCHLTIISKVRLRWHRRSSAGEDDLRFARPTFPGTPARPTISASQEG
jgi:hypothetical protein